MRKCRKQPGLYALYAALIILYYFFGCLLVLSCNNANATEPMPDEYYDSPEYLEQLRYDIDAESYGEPVDGMYFSTEHMVEAYEYDDAYAIVYDDPDAGFKDAEIIVTPLTYYRILQAEADDVPLRGELHQRPGNLWEFVEIDE